MTDPDANEIAAWVQDLDEATLRAVLIELASNHDTVRERLARLQLSTQPRKLAAAFRATLSGWRRTTRYLDYRQSRGFATELDAWLGQVERELLPRDPALALELFEAMIASDAVFFERADDSDGCIGDAIRTACRLWLQTAARCDAPASGWTARIRQLVDADAYGAREPLLRNANLLLDEPALRALVAQFETELDERVEAVAASGAPRHSAFSASGSLRLLADALRDPDVEVRAVLRHSPVPNAVQKAGFARAYLDCGRAADALSWLDGHWGHQEDTRLRLLAQAYADLQRADECTDIRRRLFEATGSVEDYRAWCERLPAESRGAAEAEARRRAQDHPDPVTSAHLLLEVGDEPAAESVLVARYGELNGRDHSRLQWLAETMEARHRAVGATACYRALLLDILSRAYVRAYVHAARYLGKLRNLAREAPDPRPMESHESFEAAIRAKHARKVSFWNHVKAG
jgi:hypothetical protein